MSLKPIHLYHLRLDEPLISRYLAPEGRIIIALMEDLGDVSNLHVEDILMRAMLDLLTLPLHESLEVLIGL